MFSLLRTALTLLIILLAVGFYLGWFTFSRPIPDPRSDKVNISVSVDKNKVRSDIQSAEQTLTKRMQDINTAPPAGADTSRSSPQRVAPGLNFGPIQYQPGNQTGGASNPPSYQPSPVPTPDYQYTPPLNLPPPGEGR